MTLEDSGSLYEIYLYFIDLIIKKILINISYEERYVICDMLKQIFWKGKKKRIFIRIAWISILPPPLSMLAGI